jgi:hypothetical protein
LIFKDLPLLKAVGKSFELVREYGFWWFIVTIASVGLAFIIFPDRAKQEKIMDAVRNEKENMDLLISKYEIKQEEKELVKQKDPEIMERMVREEFNLVNKRETE